MEVVSASGEVTIIIPNQLHELTFEDGHTQYTVDSELENVDGIYTITESISLISEDQQLTMTTVGGETVLISIAEILDRTNRPVEFSLNGSTDPFYDPMTLPQNPPIPALDFYIHDHLGNTRIVYNSSWDCNDGQNGVSYTLEMVIDYYPYGKVLREFVNGQQERYLTTQHERDVDPDSDREVWIIVAHGSMIVRWGGF